MLYICLLHTFPSILDTHAYLFCNNTSLCVCNLCLEMMHLNEDTLSMSFLLKVSREIRSRFMYYIIFPSSNY